MNMLRDSAGQLKEGKAWVTHRDSFKRAGNTGGFKPLFPNFGHEIKGEIACRHDSDKHKLHA
jgi:hypothetical protein